MFATDHKRKLPSLGHGTFQIPNGESLRLKERGRNNNQSGITKMCSTNPLSNENIFVELSNESKGELTIFNNSQIKCALDDSKQNLQQDLNIIASAE